MKNSITFFVSILPLLTSCFSSNPDKFGHPSDYLDAPVSINEDLDVTYRYQNWSFTYDGTTYIKCDHVNESDISGTWKKERNSNFENFLFDFYEIFRESTNYEAAVLVGKGLSPTEYEVTLENDYWYFYGANERVLLDDKVTYIQNADINNYMKYEYFTCYCFLPLEKELIFLTVAQFSWNY